MDIQPEGTSPQAAVPTYQATDLPSPDANQLKKDLEDTANSLIEKLKLNKKVFTKGWQRK